MNRVTFARSTYSGVGDQTMSLTGPRYGARGAFRVATACTAGCGGPRPFDIHGAMGPRVGVAGVGWSGFAPTTQGISYKELMFEAARGAYADAGVDPRSEIDSFVCCSEDIEEGTSIFDEYVPDQLGAVQRPVQTVASDGLFGVATAVMLIRSGVASTVAVESHSKASDVVSPRPGRSVRDGSGPEPAARRVRDGARRPRDASLAARDGPDRGRMRGRRVTQPRARGLEPPRLLRGRRRSDARLRPAHQRAGRRARRRVRRARAGQRRAGTGGRGLHRRRRAGARMPPRSRAGSGIGPRPPSVPPEPRTTAPGSSPPTSSWPRSTTRTRTSSSSTSMRSGSRA